MSKVTPSSAVDPSSVDPKNTEAWEKAKDQAKDAGIQWERPEGDKRSAKEILEKSDLLKNLGDQSGVRESLEKRVGGKIGEDADATFRAVQVLEHIERFEQDGKTIVGGDLGNGEVNGFKRSGQAENGTEAGRLQDFGKYGFGHLKGELQHIETASEDPEARKDAEALGIEWELPEGDKSSAKDIIDGDPLLKNLGEQSNIKKMLKERVGDYEKDANAAHRAKQVLYHIENYDSDGKRIAGKDIGNGEVNGFKGSGDAVNGTEAGRLQDFGKYGFSHLKGEIRDGKGGSVDKDAKAKAEALGIVWDRPKNDTRSAQEIIDKDPLLKNLGNQSDVKDMLKEQVGDFETNADAAFRASQVLKHVETYDKTGNSTGGKSDGKINGFKNSGEAEHNSEAGRLQDFGKYGFDALKGEMTDTITPEAEAKEDKARIDAVNEARKEAGLPPIDKQDITQLVTSEKGTDGKNLTVTESSWQKVMADWKKGIADGTIKADDDRAKLYNTMKAGAFADNGAQMYTLSISEGVTTKAVTGKDMEGVIDGQKVDAQIEKLMKSDAVNKDLAAARKTALGKVEGGEKTVKELKDMATSTEYARYIQELSKDPKMKDVATDDISQTYTSLLAADPEAAAKFAQNMQIDTMTMELNALMGDRSKISDENVTLAGTDTGKMILTLIKKGALDLGRRAAEMQKVLEGILGDKKTSAEFAKALQEMGAKFSHTGTIDPKEVEKVLGSGKYKGLEGGTIRGFFEEMTKAGVIGSLGGMVSLASGIYQLAGKGGTLADTTEERLSIAKDFVSFIGAGKHFADLSNYIVGNHNKEIIDHNKKIDDKYAASDVEHTGDGPDPRHDETKELKTKAEIDAMKKQTSNKSLLGLDKTLNDLVGTPKEVTPAGEHNNFDRFNEAMTDALDASSSSEKYKERLAEFDTANMDPKDRDKIIKSVEEGFNTRPGVLDADGNQAGKGHKAASAFLLVASAGADTFAGAADIAIGALTIKKGLKSGDDTTVAKGAITVAAGGFGVAGGVASGLGLLKGLQFVKAVAAPSFLISAVLSIATFIPDIINDIKKTNQINTYRDDMQDFFVQLEKDGLLTKDGLDNFRFLDAYMASYGQRDAPDGISVFDYRADEAEHFRGYWDGEDGKKAEERGQFSSGFGLDEDNHDDYAGDGDNLNTDLEDTSAS